MNTGEGCRALAASAAEADLSTLPPSLCPKYLQNPPAVRGRIVVRRASGSRLPLPRDSGACSAASSTAWPASSWMAPRRGALHRQVRTERVPPIPHAHALFGAQLAPLHCLLQQRAQHGQHVVDFGARCVSASFSRCTCSLVIVSRRVAPSAGTRCHRRMDSIA
jgi:hypothetical protein